MNEILLYGRNTAGMENLMIFLEGEGDSVYRPTSEQETLWLVEQKNFHLLLLDRKSEEEKFQFIREVRKVSAIPIIVISEKNTEQAVIEALNAGADDFMAYPFNLMEVAARIHSQIRRYTELTNLCENINQIYRIHDLVVDDRKRKVTVAGKEVRLTPIEYKILKLLVREKGKVFSIEQIYETIWNMQAIGADNTIAVHIRHIREKIERNPKEPQYLKVVWGTGYKVG